LLLQEIVVLGRYCYAGTGDVVEENAACVLLLLLLLLLLLQMLFTTATIVIIDILYHTFTDLAICQMLVCTHEVLLHISLQ
jgi:hypothetical protein